jgi:hypothetical protein
MRRARRIRMTAAATLLLLVVLGAPTGAQGVGGAEFQVPAAHGVVDLGDRVTYQLGGACQLSRVRAEVTAAGTTLRGPLSTGCSGTAVLPSLEQVLGAGHVEGQPVDIALVADGTTRLPLRLDRLEPDLGEVVAGSPRVVPATDPLGGVNAVAMAAGDVIDLGPVNLDMIESVSVRNLADAVGGLWELRAGAPDGRVIARSAFGPLGNLASAGDDGWLHSVAQLAWRGSTSLGDHNVFGNLTPAVGDAPRLYLAAVTVPGTPVLVNWVDLNGSGAADVFRFTDERPGDFEVLFDGSSFDGWQHTGPGRFELVDGAMRADHDPHEIGWAWLWYSRARFSDFNLRLRFRIENWSDNGGILLRHGDPRDDPNKVTAEADEVQIQEEFENHTGGIAHEADAHRLATNVVGEWNQVEIIARGDTYLVRINGREVMRHQTAHERREGFISVENEQLLPADDAPPGSVGHLWYDDIRVHRCQGHADPLCAVD